MGRQPHPPHEPNAHDRHGHEMNGERDNPRTHMGERETHHGGDDVVGGGGGGNGGGGGKTRRGRSGYRQTPNQ